MNHPLSNKGMGPTAVCNSVQGPFRDESILSQRTYFVKFYPTRKRSGGSPERFSFVKTGGLPGDAPPYTPRRSNSGVYSSRAEVRSWV